MSRRSKKNKSLNGMPVVVAVLLIICIVFAYKSISVQNKRNELEEDYAELVEELKEEKSRTEALKARQDYMETDEYIEYIARTRLGLIYDDEILFVPEDSSK